MKYIFLALSTLSLCACSVSETEQEPTIDSIVLLEEYTENGITCIAEGIYPKISGLTSKQVEVNINSYFDEFTYGIREDMRNCPKFLANVTEDEAELTDTTDVDFVVTRLDNQYLSIILMRSQYFEGAARPNNSIDTFVFDIATGQPIPVEDFADTSVLTEYVKTQVAKEGLGDYPSETSNPIKKYFLTEKDLVLVDLFFVHAIQAFEVKVPLAEIVDLNI